MVPTKYAGQDTIGKSGVGKHNHEAEVWAGFHYCAHQSSETKIRQALFSVPRESIHPSNDSLLAAERCRWQREQPAVARSGDCASASLPGKAVRHLIGQDNVVHAPPCQ